MLLDFGHLNYPENQDLTTQRSEKSCSVENWGNFESIISANSSFSKNRKSTLLRGVNLPEILEETHTGMTVWSIPVKPYAHTHTHTHRFIQAEKGAWAGSLPSKFKTLLFRRRANASRAASPTLTQIIINITRDTEADLLLALAAVSEGCQSHLWDLTCIRRRSWLLWRIRLITSSSWRIMMITTRLL